MKREYSRLYRNFSISYYKFIFFISLKKHYSQQDISISGVEVYIMKIFANCKICYIYKDQ